MGLTQTKLRSILAQILSLNESAVIPMQGNFFNPQESNSSSSTWCGFWTKHTSSKAVQYFTQIHNVDNPPVSSVQKVSTVGLQFIGRDAEFAAEMTAHWPYRQDVIELFGEIGCVMFMNSGDIVTSQIDQPGGNSTLAYNVEIKLQWVSEVQTIQTKVDSIEVSGDIVVP